MPFGEGKICKPLVGARILSFSKIQVIYTHSFNHRYIRLPFHIRVRRIYSIRIHQDLFNFKQLEKGLQFLTIEKVLKKNFFLKKNLKAELKGNWIITLFSKRILRINILNQELNPTIYLPNEYLHIKYLCDRVLICASIHQ